MTRCLIVAMSDNRAIGVRGELPWHLGEDLKFFKRTTMGFPIIMGRTTFESIGRPLPGRLNIVLTHDPGRIAHADSLICASSLDDAFMLAGRAEKCFVIGGATIYREAFTVVDRLYVTHVHTIINNADAFFPEINSDIWDVESRSEMFTDSQTGFRYEFVSYLRKR
jgi:dihydrofolate reductase